MDILQNEAYRCAGGGLDKTEGFGVHKWGLNNSVGLKIMKRTVFLRLENIKHHLLTSVKITQEYMPGTSGGGRVCGGKRFSRGEKHFPPQTLFARR